MSITYTCGTLTNVYWFSWTVLYSSFSVFSRRGRINGIVSLNFHWPKEKGIVNCACDNINIKIALVEVNNRLADELDLSLSLSLSRHLFCVHRLSDSAIFYVHTHTTSTTTTTTAAAANAEAQMMWCQCPAPKKTTQVGRDGRTVVKIPARQATID